MTMTQLLNNDILLSIRRATVCPLNYKTTRKKRNKLKNTLRTSD